MAEVNAADLDAMIIPGGFGVAKNLSDYAMSGPECSVNPDAYRLVSEMFLLKKPRCNLYCSNNDYKDY